MPRVYVFYHPERPSNRDASMCGAVPRVVRGSQEGRGTAAKSEKPEALETFSAREPSRSRSKSAEAVQA